MAVFFNLFLEAEPFSAILIAHGFQYTHGLSHRHTVLVRCPLKLMANKWRNQQLYGLSHSYSL